MQEFADLGDPRVEKVTSSNSAFTGSAVNLGMSTPFIQLASWNYSAGKFFEVSNVNIHKTGAKIKSEYGIYSSGTSTNFGANERNAIKAFYAGVTKTEFNGKSYADTTGTFVWTYETNNGTHKKLKRAVNRLLDKTYMYNEVPVIVPSYDEDLNYTKVDFNLKYNKSYTEHLMTLKATDFKYDLLAQVKYECKGNSKCVKDGTRSVNYRLKKLFKKVKEMKSLYGKDNKKFVKAYAEFGQQAYKNKYLFKKVYDEAKKCGLALTYTITGEKIPRHEKQFVFAETAACKK